MKLTSIRRLLAAALLSLAVTAAAQVPNILNYQGRIAVRGVNFDGTGQFKFALVNNDGSTTYWSNDGTSNAGSQPTGAVSLSVSKGLYSVMLGNTALANMNSIPPGVFNNADVRLRVWFSDGSNGFQLITPDQRIGAVGYAIMAGNVPDGNDKEAKINSGSVNMAGTAWREGTTAGAPTARYSAATVWTGSEVLLWGGRNGRSSFLADGARYNPTTQTWAALPLAAGFQGRNDHTAVWTGTDMIIWGGWANYPNFYGNGIKYNPSTNSLTAISNIAAPAARQGHTAVWTGTEMIVWGGGYMPDAFDWSNFNNGGRYNPVTNTWTSVSTTGAPVARRAHVAVWTGTEMIIWGGLGTSLSGSWNDGGRYNPQTDTWTAISSVNAPSGRHYARAFWTGSKMIIWGGEETYQQSSLPNTGGIYDPATDSWTTINNSVLTGRFGMVAAWTGTEMLVWGGQAGATNYGDGARFNPATMTWSKITDTGAPSARSFGANAHIGGVWSGSSLIFFGGYASADAPLSGTYIYDTDHAQNAEPTLKLTTVMPTRSGNTTVGTSSIKEKSLKLSPGWDTDLQKGKVSTSEFKHVLSLGRCTAGVDLSADDTVELYPGIHYLDPASKTRDYLESKLKAKPMSSRRPINAAGFPARSIFSYDYSGDFDGFGHFILVVDVSDQVVGVQLLQNVPKALMLNSHSSQWSVYNFLQSRKKGIRSYKIAYNVPSGAKTFEVQSELIDADRKSREWVRLILARKFADLAMHVIEKSN